VLLLLLRSRSLRVPTGFFLCLFSQVASQKPSTTAAAATATAFIVTPGSWRKVATPPSVENSVTILKLPKQSQQQQQLKQ